MRFFAFAVLLFGACDPSGSPEASAAEVGLDTAVDLDFPIALMAYTGSPTWTVEVSDETPPATCPSGSIAIGFDCDGGYCDNMQLRCQPTTGLTFSGRSWTSWFSEEATSFRTCSGNGFVTGIACRGGNCDDLSLECTTTSRPGTSCQWSAWFSEEDATFTVPARSYIKGLQCSGSRCDSVRAFYCLE